RGVLRPRPLFDRLTAEGAAWSDGTMDPYDAIIWCTGFRPTLGHLAPLGLRRENGVPKTVGTRSADEPRLHLLGHGGWTGFASATLIGTGRTAKDAVHDITSHLPAASPPQWIGCRLCHRQVLANVELCLHRSKFRPWPRPSRPKHAPPTWPPPSRLWPTRTV